MDRVKKDKVERNKRKEKVKLLKNLAMGVNMQLALIKDKSSEEYVEKLQDLSDVHQQIFSLKRNKNNSREYSWKPHVGLNRRMRRM